MLINEIFRSIQGEGFLTGTESIFVRTGGCNLRCWYCDTQYASWTPEGEDLSIDQILDRVKELDRSPTERPSPVEHVVITGGEPMLFAELIPLCKTLREDGRHVTIETNGTLYLPVECDLMSISPKLSNSLPGPEHNGPWTQRHQRDREASGVIRRLIEQYAYQVKFVVDCFDDCLEVEAYLAEIPRIDRGRVMLMPQGTDPKALAQKAEWLAPYCAEHDLKYCPRRQIEWFGAGRGK